MPAVVPPALSLPSEADMEVAAAAYSMPEAAPGLLGHPLLPAQLGIPTTPLEQSFLVGGFEETGRDSTGWSGETTGEWARASQRGEGRGATAGQKPGVDVPRQAQTQQQPQVWGNPLVSVSLPHGAPITLDTERPVPQLGKIGHACPGRACFLMITALTPEQVSRQQGCSGHSRAAAT